MFQMGWVRGFLVALCLMASSAVLAQGAPNQLSFQGRLVRADGTPESGTHTLTFDLYDVASGGTALWSQTVANVPVANGYYAVVLGSPAAPFDAALFDGQTRYLGIRLAGQSEFTPRVSLVSVPYAINSAQLGGRAASDFSRADHTHPTLSLAGSGSATTAARSDHAHALSCVSRQNSGSDATVVTATCNSNETLTGGGCISIQSSSTIFEFGPTGAKSPNGSGGAGYSCKGGTGSDGTTATAICCTVD